MVKYEIKIKHVSPEILNHGFSEAENGWGIVDGKKTIDWYKIIIPQTFRGKYTLYLCEGDICGVFQGMSIQDHEFNSLMDKLSFRSPEWVEWTKNMLLNLKTLGIIDFDIISWEEPKNEPNT